MVDGCRSKLVNVVSGVPQGSVSGPSVVPLVTAELFSIVENQLYCYADDSTLVAVVPSPGERVAVSESMNRNLNRASVWCNLWGMKLNASKTKTIIVSRSRTVYPQLRGSSENKYKFLLYILEKNYINKTCRSYFEKMFLFVKIFCQP